MYYGSVKACDIANGEGVRVTLFVSGCTHHCKGCFNEETWSFNYGQPYTEETEQKILQLLQADYINGLTLLGGEPMEPPNQEVLAPLVSKVKALFPQKTIWCYTGYTLETDLLQPSRARGPLTDNFLSLIDVLVDGKFILELKDIRLQFRGSSNQRVIDLPATLKNGSVVLWQDKEKQGKL